MNILIVTQRFYPYNRIASFRINSFAKYFREAGYSVTVVTEGERDEAVNWNGCDVHYIKDPIMTQMQCNKFVRENKKWVPRRALRALETRILWGGPCIWRAKAYKKIEELFQKNNFDIVLSSYGPLAPHVLVMKLLKRGYKFFWIADMRDEMSKHPLNTKLRTYRFAIYERKILAKADLVVSVSKPIIDDFKTMCSHGRFLEVKNGYDYEEYHEVNFQSQFTMGYIGNFYGMAVPGNLFNAFSELIEEGRLPRNSRIKIVGNSLKLDIPDKIASNVVQYEAVPHEEAIRISMTEVDVLLMVHKSGRKGVYSGKLFDYLATNKPILALYDPNDVVAPLLAETKAGFIVDEADKEGIKDMMMKCYRIWKNKEVLPRDWDKIRQYSRRNQIQILLDYLSEVFCRGNN
ncbi:glycosyltransferase [Butyricimonas synergistica]|uniref:glycosyltransferase n=1 Tax=Butyricimonas synergistica TaxID=544644 RepID=UPI00037B1A5C|nr:glycosyltransferase [Butyricimonas synergistica]